MKTLFKNLLILFLGLVASCIVISLVQFANARLFPLPEGLDFYKDHELLKKVITVPMMLMVELSYILGSFAGGYIIGRYIAFNPYLYAGLLGLLLTLTNVINIMSIPHPVWMIVLTSITFIPMSLLGCKLTQK
jgi:hypothetical protein